MEETRLDRARARKIAAAWSYDELFAASLAARAADVRALAPHAEGEERGLLDRAAHALEEARRLRLGEPAPAAKRPEDVVALSSWRGGM